MLRVLTYHRVANSDDAGLFDPSLISATPAVFERQMRHLAWSYNVVGTEQVLEWLESGRPIPPRAVLITFDDAYGDFASTAWPILSRYNLPATLFVPTAYPDRPERVFWWDRLYRAFHGARANRVKTSFAGSISLRTPAERWESHRRVKARIRSAPRDTAMDRVHEICSALNEAAGMEDNGVLRWSQLRRLAREGVTLGAHTRTHPWLDRLDTEAIHREAAGSREDLRREIGWAPPIVSYPDGAHDVRVLRVVRAAGFVLGFTTSDGMNGLSAHNRLRLRRTNVTRRTTATVFRLRMLPPFARVDAWRHRDREARA